MRFFVLVGISMIRHFLLIICSTPFYCYRFRRSMKGKPKRVYPFFFHKLYGQWIARVRTSFRAAFLIECQVPERSFKYTKFPGGKFAVLSIWWIRANSSDIPNEFARIWLVILAQTLSRFYCFTTLCWRISPWSVRITTRYIPFEKGVENSSL